MTDGSVRVARGGLYDLDDVMVVMGDSFEPCFGEAWTAPQCAGLLPLPGMWLTIARRDDAPLGFAMARIVAGEAELLLLAVRRRAQRRGVGRLLLEDFMSSANKSGAERLHLEVRDGNPAINLYAHAGFTVVGRRRDYYRGGDGQAYDALTLARTIADQ